MSSQGISTQAVVMSYNTSTGLYVVGDAANITLKFIKDGSVTAPTNSVVEPSGAGLKGAYTLALTSSETQCQTLWIGGNSSSANTIIIPITLTFTSSAVGPVTIAGTPSVNVSQWNGVTVQGFIPPDVILTHSSTAQAGTTTTITLDSSASRTDNFYLNQIVTLIGGSGAGESAIISAYSGATQLATIVGNWAVSPSANTKFALEGFGSVPATVSGGVNVTQWQGASVNQLVSGLVPVSASGGSVSSVSGTVASITSGVNVTQWLGSPPNSLVSGLVATATSGGSIATVSGAVGSVTGAVGSVIGSVASVTSGVNVTQWNFTTTQGSIPPDVIYTHSSTAQAGTTTTITLDSSASRTDNFYLNQIVVLTAGSGAGEAAIISAYSGATQLATIVGTWATAPSANTRFAMHGLGSVPATVSGGVNVTQWQGASVNQLVSGLVATSASGGSISSVSGTVASITSGVNVTQWLGSPPNALVSGLVATSTSGGSIGAVSGSVGSVTGAVGSVTGNVGGSVASVTSGVSVTQWNFVTVQGFIPPDTILTRFSTAQAGTTTTITLDSGASRTDNFYINQIVALTAGSGAGESAIISAYSGATQLATIVGNWAVAPSANTKFVLEGFGSVPTTISGGVNVTQWQGTSVNQLVNGLVPTSASGGSISSVSGTVASITSGVNVTQWLGSPPNSLVSGLVATSTSGGSIATVSGSVGSVAGSVASITSGVNVTQWLGSPPNPLVSGLVATSTSGGSIATVTGSVGSVTAGVNVTQINGVTAATSTAQLGVNVITWRDFSPAPLIAALVQTQVSGTPSVIVTTNNDKSGYSLTQTFPTNFSSLAITGGGATTVGTNNDKTGYSLTSGEETAIANAVWDNASGIETNVTPRQALRYIAAAETGITTGALTNTFTISAISASGTTRITATTDSSGNRSAVVFS